MTLRQQITIGLLVLVAFLCLGVAIAFSGDTSPSTPVFSGSAADGGGDRSADPDAPPVTLDVDPVLGWFPAAGEGSGCSEVVGVRLLPGYTAILTINGTVIPEEETNVYTDFENRVLSAGGSQGQVTWGPEEGCPFGTILRPTSNQVVACIYRVEDGPTNCTTRANPSTFDF